MTHAPAGRRRPLVATAALAVALTTGLATLGSSPAAAVPTAAPSPLPLAAPAVVQAGPAAGRAAAAAPADSTVTAGGVELENSFVSAVGWVKPGESYPSRILLTNPGTTPVAGVSVTVTAPTGTSFTAAKAPTGTTRTLAGGSVTWTVPTLAGTPAGAEPTEVVLVLEQQTATLSQLPTLVWRDLSTTATLQVGGRSVAAGSHGPKVIPPSAEYDTARYGDRPFPVVPVQYRDRAYQADHSGEQLEAVINSPSLPGSTFNLFQEMSLGQLFPEGTVPSAGLETADFDSYEPGFDFTQVEPGQTCAGGLTQVSTPAGDLPAPGTVGGAGYDERITDGVYNLPGNNAYYGADANGSAVIGSLAGVGALQNIDSGCGPAAKLVYDAAAIADPEIDYSDYDTDKDGVVDFFMAVFAGCGGNGGSQLGAAACDYSSDALPYDNVWPHSSSLEFSYTDPETGLSGFVSDDQLRNLEGQPMFYTDATRQKQTTTKTAFPVFVRVGPYNVNPETAIDKASVISHEYGHSLGLPDFYSTGSRETYGDWNLMATDKSQNMDVFSRQELGWIVPEVLAPGTSPTVRGWTDSKQDTDSITWRTPAGAAYTLTEGSAGRVQNAQAYVASLPGRQLLDPAAFDSGDKASKTHAWWSGSGNDFGCAPTGGHNLDLSIPRLADLPAGTTATLSFKSLWDIEWDFDYGFVLTTTDGGKTYRSHASQQGYTTSTTDPLAGNPNQNSCLATFDNGITGSSGSYAAGTEVSDRKLGTVPEAVFLADSYDVSDLVGEPGGALRFSYSTDPGLAQPGWFIDDVEVTVTEPGKSPYDVLATDFETSGDPSDDRVFNGGCREDLTTAQQCTVGWSHVAAGEESADDHAYYLELRDRSGFDLDGKGQIDRDPIGFAAGLSMVYTDEAHGYGNAGVDDPPAQTPVDSQPTPGSATPDLDDAAFTAAAGDARFSDSGEGHTDNYSDPDQDDVDERYPDVAAPWRFQYDCLSFDVLSMTGAADGPATSDGDLTGDVAFRLGGGCGAFDYGYPAADPDPGPGPVNSGPRPVATADPSAATTGQSVTFGSEGTVDRESPASDLDYFWSFDDGGTTKDAEGRTVTHAFPDAGVHDVRLTVVDPGGLTGTTTVRVTVTEPGSLNTPPTAAFTVQRPRPYVGALTTLRAAPDADAESPDEDLTYTWDLGDGGSTVDAEGAEVTTRFRSAGPRTVTLTVTDPEGAVDSEARTVTVRRIVVCGSGAVDSTGSWRQVRSGSAPGGQYCDNLGRGRGRDTLRLDFSGPSLEITHGLATGGGRAVVVVDGKRVGALSFRGDQQRPEFGSRARFTGLGRGEHTVRLIVRRGAAYVDSFVVSR